MGDDLVAHGSNGNGKTVGLDGLVGPFQPCDSMILQFLHIQYVTDIYHLLTCF